MNEVKLSPSRRITKPITLYNLCPLTRHNYDILAKTHSRMTHTITFSRQNERSLIWRSARNSFAPLQNWLLFVIIWLLYLRMSTPIYQHQVKSILTECPSKNKFHTCQQVRKVWGDPMATTRPATSASLVLEELRFFRTLSVAFFFLLELWLLFFET